MIKYAFNPAGKKNAKAYGRGLRVSTKNSEVVCSEIRGKSLPKAKALLSGMLEQTRNLDGRYYTNATRAIFDLVKSAENNAVAKGLKTDRLVVNVCAHQGFNVYRPRRFKNRRQQRKVTHLEVTLQEK